MYIFKNAFRNLGRNKGRNILLAASLFFVISTAALSIVIRSAAGLMIDDYRKRFGSEVFLVTEGSQTAPQNIEAEKLLRFGQSDLLQSSWYIAKSVYAARGMKAVDDGGEENLGNIDHFNPKGAIYGSSRREINNEFQSGVRIIVSGRTYQNDSECIINKKFAEYNGLEAGDPLTLDGFNENGGQTFTITGIYEDLSLEADSNPYGTALGSRANEIYTTLEAVLASAAFARNGTLDAKFFLKDPSALSAFEEEVRNKGLPAGIRVGTDEAGYRKIIAPVEGLKKITALFLYGVLILGSLVLVLISVMAVRERKYEIGVLRAMGMKKRNIALGMVGEAAMITAVCLLLGLGIASLAARPAAAALLQRQAAIVRQADPGGEAAASEKQPLEELQVSLNAAAVGWMILLSAALAAISSLSGVLFIMRYEPRKILSQRE